MKKMVPDDLSYVLAAEVSKYSVFGVQFKRIFVSIVVLIFVSSILVPACLTQIIVDKDLLERCQMETSPKSSELYMA